MSSMKFILLLCLLIPLALVLHAAACFGLALLMHWAFPVFSLFQWFIAVYVVSWVLNLSVSQWKKSAS